MYADSKLSNTSTQQLTPDLQPSPPPDAPSGEPQLTIKDDPQYKEWFRKLKYGAKQRTADYRYER